MSKQTLTGTTKMEPNGRVMIPAKIRKEFGLKTGATFIVSYSNKQLILESPLKYWEELQSEFTKAYKGKKLLSEELIEDRRKEAIREGYA